MTTEHQTAPDLPDPDPAGSADLPDDGPLDPSVFFGLFDDLGDGDTAGVPSDKAETTVDGEAATDVTDNQVTGNADTADTNSQDTDSQDIDADPADADADQASTPNEPDEVADVTNDEPDVVSDRGTVGDADGAEQIDVPPPPSDGLDDDISTDLDQLIDSIVSDTEADMDAAFSNDGFDTNGFVETPPPVNDDPSVHTDGDHHLDEESDPAGPELLADGTPPSETTVDMAGPESPLTAELDPSTDVTHQVDESFGTYQPPPLIGDHTPHRFGYPSEDPNAVVLGGLDERLSPTPTYTEPDVYVQGSGQVAVADQRVDTARPVRTADQRQESSLTLTAVAMTIAASFAVGLIGLAAMFALADGDSLSQEAGSDEAQELSDDATAEEQQAAEEDASATTTDETTAPSTSSTPDTLDVISGTEEPAADVTADSQAPTDGADINPLLDPIGAMETAAGAGRLDLLSLQFVPGTDTLSADSQRLLDDLGPRLAALDVPVVATVRATGQSTAQANLDLSQQQAAALEAALIATGVAQTQVRITALGAGPLSASLPVPDFVAATPELGDAVFSESVAASGPFSIGSSPTDTSSFRVESTTATTRLRQAMSQFAESTIGLAAYSFFAPDNETARAAASQLADGVVNDLTSGDVSADRITVITPGAAPYVITPEVGGHIWLQAGSESSLAFEVAGIDPATIAFEPGSSTLTVEAQAALDGLALQMAETTNELTIDVRTYTEATPEANTTLSQQQAVEVGRYLSEVGSVAANRLRTFGSGPSTYYPNDGSATVTLTVGPSA